MRIERVWVMPNKWTFSMKPVQKLISEEVIKGLWIDPFAGENSPASIRNDADESKPAEKHMDGLDFLKSFADESVDGVFFDPPYSTEQALRIYKPKHGGTAGRAEYWAKCKDEIRRIIKKDGEVICFGWDTTGVGSKRGFELERVLVMCHGACHNDTLVTVERKL